MNLRKKFERFCFRNRNKGIPNLMLYLCVGTGFVTIASLINGGEILYSLLCFDKAAILKGQVWRLVTWLFTENMASSPLLSILFLYFFYRLGQAVEHSIGTFKFNLFYLVGIVLMDAFAMIFCPTQTILIGNMMIPPQVFTILYGYMAYYLHLSMVLAYSTMYPESQFLVLFVIPVKAWVIALVDLLLIGISIFNMCYPDMLFPHCLFPLVGLLNYFLFFAPDMHNLLPLSWRAKLHRKRQNRRKPESSRPKVIPFDTPVKNASGNSGTEISYNHRCTVCGRTDVTHPDLEFRYCSRCNGYHCYCEEHISNHTHVQ